MITAALFWLWALLSPWLWWLLGGIAWAWGGVCLAWSHALQCCGVVWVGEKVVKWWRDEQKAEQITPEKEPITLSAKFGRAVHWVHNQEGNES